MSSPERTGPLLYKVPPPQWWRDTKSGKQICIQYPSIYHITFDKIEMIGSRFADTNAKKGMYPMNKFAIKLVKGDNNTILETFDTKEEALAAGKKYRAMYTSEQGLISCIQADFDENNNLTDGSYKLFDAWR